MMASCLSVAPPTLKELFWIMPTQIEAARNGIITKEMKYVAASEHRRCEWIRDNVASGRIVIPANHHHTSLSPCGIGEGLRTKVNVNLGVSGDKHNYATEMEKVTLADHMHADAIMDLSNCGKTSHFRTQLIKTSPAAIGTVPIYDAVGYTEKHLEDLRAEDFLDVVKKHAEDGADFMTIHAGITRNVVNTWLSGKRTMNIVSRGGSLMFAWMHMTGNENPFFEYYDQLCDILRTYDVTISLGDAMRPGCLDDATDEAQIAELVQLGSLVERARKHGVQVMVEGPGHIPLDEVRANITCAKSICHHAPLYVLGPLVTDIAPGYDHITAAIGGAVAAGAGADFLCYVTPSEHLRLPSTQDVRDGIVATQIAAHAGDIAKHIPGAAQRDSEMAHARHAFDWDRMFDIAIDGDRARHIYEETPPQEEGTCTMCGKMCAVKTVNDALRGLGLSI